jgi:DNA repair exonuclease SbcCD nuclease subunit
MSKILIFSDLHVACHKKSEQRLNDCLKALEWIFKCAAEHNVNDIICVGDFFHDRQKIEVLTYQKAFEIFASNLKKIKSDTKMNKIYLLLGNHDMWYNERWNISSVFPLGALDEDVVIVDKPSSYEIAGHEVGFLPYTKNPIEDIKKIDIGNKELLFAHVAIDGALWNVKFKTIADVCIEHDGDWNRVFMGHYHAAQKLTEKVEYVGSPLQLDFGEVDQEKHIIVYDMDTDEKQYIKNDFSPKHFYYHPHKDGDVNDWMEKSKIKKGDFVNIRTKKIQSSDNIEYQKIIAKNTCEVVRSKSIKKNVREDKKIIEEAKSILFNEEQMAEEYIKSVDTTGLEHKTLLEVFNKIRSKKGN